MRRGARRSALGVALAAAALAAGCGRGDLDAADPLRRAAAVRALRSGDRALAALVVAQGDSSPLVRAAAAERFAARGGPAAADALGKLLLDPSADVAVVAARGLAEMPGEPRARQQLVTGYAGATAGGRAAIADALDRIGVSLREAIEAEARALWERNLATLQAARGPARAGAAEDLGASGRAEALQRLVSLLDPEHPEAAVAAGAAQGLGDSGEPAARPWLEALLESPDAAIAEVAAVALGRLGDPRAADALAAAGIGDSGRIAAAVADALAALPDAPEVGVALCDLALRAADPHVAARAARDSRRRDADCPARPLLARLGRPGTEAALAALAELGLRGPAAQGAAERVVPLLERSPDAAVRAAAAHALARLGAPAGASAVERRLAAVMGRGAPGDDREAAALLAAAGRLRLGSAEPLLLATARSGRAELRAGALEGLGADGGAAAVDVLAGALDDADPRVRAQAADGLARAGPRGEPALAAAAERATGATAEWRIALARALGETGSADGVPAVAALLDGASAPAAAAALARLGAPTAVPALVAYLGRPGAPARADAIEALAQLVARDAAPAIAALLTDDRPEVRAAAARALGRLRHETASPRLEALRSDYYGRVRRAAVEALARFPSGVPRARR